MIQRKNQNLIICTNSSHKPYFLPPFVQTVQTGQQAPHLGLPAHHYHLAPCSFQQLQSERLRPSFWEGSAKTPQSSMRAGLMPMSILTSQRRRPWCCGCAEGWGEERTRTRIEEAVNRGRSENWKWYPVWLEVVWLCWAVRRGEERGKEIEDMVLLLYCTIEGIGAVLARDCTFVG